MTEQMHTPGPWMIDEIGGMPFITSANAVIVELPYRGDQIDQRANARLIAAAPDLLALLKEAADFVQPFNRAGDLLDRIDAAIARATVQS